MSTKTPKQNHKLPRLYVTQAIEAQVLLPLDQDQWHYVRNVMRLVDGDDMMIFNGQHGEWRASLVYETKKRICLKPMLQTKLQPTQPELLYAFAPLKKGRLDYMIQKATELGASLLQPVLTDYTDNHKINLQKLAANAVEAAEQCTMLSVPQVAAPLKFDNFLAQFSKTHQIIFCDEAAPTASPISLIAALAGQKICVLVGPEGGFSDDERQALLALEQVTTISLGPRIMRADTAAIAALTLVQATIGDW
ncbi:MAG: 16S rRNA (uracil(1498)-N(3))-methyltransferase [Hyphomicrobiales bacterium]|nr:MAG: 16S rRNA (uracil(1498)-N(3))-methyltransferase [Hyphomicrobiales bacterium]